MQIAWAALQRIGLQQLRLRPKEFWDLTPAELAIMLGQSGGKAPMSRKELHDLMADYPDEGAE